MKSYGQLMRGLKQLNSTGSRFVLLKESKNDERRILLNSGVSIINPVFHFTTPQIEPRRQPYRIRTTALCHLARTRTGRLSSAYDGAHERPPVVES